MLAVILFSLGALAGEPTNWVTHFDEHYLDNPAARFKMLPVPPLPGSTRSGGTGKWDPDQHNYALGGQLSLVRPVRAGAHVELALVLHFEPLKDETSRAQTDFAFVLHDRSLAGVQILRLSQETPAFLRFVRQREKGGISVVREFPVPGPALDGDWLLRYRHGHLTVLQGTNTLGIADIQQQGIPVAGVSWAQRGGTVTCEQMTLTGEPLRELTPADLESLRRAADLNAEAGRLMKEKELDAALARMEEVSDLFIAVHGENHHDSGNSLGNRASILAEMGKTEAAEKLWLRALGIHGHTLGESHPHTTLTRWRLGKHYFDIGDKAKAKQLWTRCRNDWRDVLGPEYSLVQSLNSILPGL